MTDDPNLEDSERVDEFGHDGSGDDDSYFIELYKSKDGRHFIHIVSSGYNSRFLGALGFHEWLTDDQIGSWTEV